MKRETHHSNDNDELPFLTLAAATANALRFLKLDEKQDEERRGNGDRSTDGKNNKGADEDYVGQRMKDLARFERKASGK
jgi:hypothetical protein